MIPSVTNPMGVGVPYLRRLESLKSPAGTSKSIYTGYVFSGNKLAYDVCLQCVYGGDLIGNWTGSTRDMFLIFNGTPAVQVHVAQLGYNIYNYTLNADAFNTIFAEADQQTKKLAIKINGTDQADPGLFTGSCVTWKTADKLQLYSDCRNLSQALESKIVIKKYSIWSPGFAICGSKTPSLKPR